MRSQPSVFVNCDHCDDETEVILEGRGSPAFQVDEALQIDGWILTDKGDICPRCRKDVQGEQTTSSTNS